MIISETRLISKMSEFEIYLNIGILMTLIMRQLVYLQWDINIISYKLKSGARRKCTIWEND
jgi:hypothetical protein